MIISLDAEKSFDKTQYASVLKVLEREKNQGKNFCIKVNSHLKRGKVKDAHFPQSVQNSTQTASRNNKKKKKERKKEGKKRKT